MKTIYLRIHSVLIVVFFQLTVLAQPGNWVTVLSDPAIDIYDVYFLPDAQNGWACGYTISGPNIISVIYKTTNGGTDWIKQRFNDSSYVQLKGVFFIDNNLGWMVGNSGTIYHSTNGGENWVQQSSGTGRLLESVQFINSNEGWITGGWQDGSSYLVLHTTNGGTSWQNLSFGSDAYSCESLFFFDSMNGWIGGRDNTLAPHIHRTTDGGTTWTRQNPNIGTNNIGINDIEFVNSQKGWATVTSIYVTGPVLYTEDGGATWTTQYTTGLHYHKLAVRDSMNIAVVGVKILPPASEKIFVSSDGGQTWNNYVTPISTYTYGIDFVLDNIWLGSKGSKILRSTDYGISWEWQNSSALFNSIGWKDNLTGWAAAGSNVGTDAYCFKTTDGGMNWYQDFDAPGGKEIFFLNDQIGWMLYEGNSSSVWRTTNGGTNWTQYYIGSGGAWIGDIFFISPDSGWACGSNGMLRFTINGGESWVTQTSGVSDYISRVFFVNSFEGWIAGGYGGGNGFIRHTTNGGQTWVAQTPASNYHLLDLFFLNENEGWVSAVGGSVQHTTDGGISWNTIGGAMHDFADKIYMVNSNEGWLLANNSVQSGHDGRGQIYYTSDGGNWWEYQWSAIWPLGVVNDISMKPNGSLWICGNHNTILKNDILVSVKDENTLPASFRLCQNYPNPFNPSTNIAFQISDGGFVSLKVYDVLGNEVATLVNEYKPAGSYEVEFSASSGIRNLPAGRQGLVSGIYFYQLKAGNYIETKRMILLK